MRSGWDDGVGISLEVEVLVMFGMVIAAADWVWDHERMERLDEQNDGSQKQLRTGPIYVEENKGNFLNR